MNQDLISIIVPIYNVEQYLEKCIESILNQTYQNLEIILVEDGSSDRCGKICDEYAQKDKRIKVIHKENGGLSDARNVGIKSATGTLIGFVDSDDYIAENMYEMLYNDLKKYDADIAICDFQKVAENENILADLIPQKEEAVRILDKKDALYLLIEGNEIKTAAWNKLYKTCLFIDIEYPKGRVIEDRATTYRLFDKANTIVMNKKVGYFYVQREESIYHQVNPILLTDWIQANNERYEDLSRNYPELNNVLILDRLILISNCIKLFYEYHMKELKLMEILKEEYIFYKKYYKEYQKELKKYIHKNFSKQERLKLRFEFVLLYFSKKLFKIYSFLLIILKGTRKSKL